MKKEFKILDVITKFMPFFYVHINSVLHKCEYNEYRLNENQIKVMMTIGLFSKMTPTDLSFGLNIQKGSLTTIIKSLVEMGFLQKESDQKDERKYNLTLTKKGKDFVAFKSDDNQKKFEQLFADISEEDCQKVVEGFSTLCKYLKSTGSTERSN